MQKHTRSLVWFVAATIVVGILASARQDPTPVAQPVVDYVVPTPVHIKHPITIADHSPVVGVNELQQAMDLIRSLADAAELQTTDDHDIQTLLAARRTS